VASLNGSTRRTWRLKPSFNETGMIATLLHYFQLRMHLQLIEMLKNLKQLNELRMMDTVLCTYIGGRLGS
jgi:hypothetical protein